MNIYEKLACIQTSLKAKKNEYNSFGKYSYRNLESIYESLKPLLKENNCSLIMKNDLEVVRDIIFRKSTARLIDNESSEAIETYTYTQEGMNHKGMSPEQCSGSTSSYSDKYCLGKLFCIDDSQDPDTFNNHEGNGQDQSNNHQYKKPTSNQAPNNQLATKPQLSAIRAICKNLSIPEPLDMDKMSFQQASDFIKTQGGTR